MLDHDVKEAAARVRLLTVEFAGQRCALMASDVVEVQRAVAIARLPRCPSIIEGAINVRGNLVPVVDVRSRLGLPPARLDPSNHFVLARLPRAQAHGVRTVAIRVDRALDIVSVSRDRIDNGAAIPGLQLVAGIAKLDDGLLVIHDLDAFLSLEEAAELGRALARQQTDG
jgi:purine-binding chemotaxis protein CheW